MANFNVREEAQEDPPEHPHYVMRARRHRGVYLYFPGTLGGVGNGPVQHCALLPVVNEPFTLDEMTPRAACAHILATWRRRHWSTAKRKHKRKFGRYVRNAS